MFEYDTLYDPARGCYVVYQRENNDDYLADVELLKMLDEPILVHFSDGTEKLLYNPDGNPRDSQRFTLMNKGKLRR